jgi:hypothetical protein
LIEPDLKVTKEPLTLMKLKEFNPDNWEVVLTTAEEQEQIKRKPIIENSSWAKIPLP